MSSQTRPTGCDLPSVTAIVPTKDRPDLVRRAVGSVLAQDYEGRLTCVVVNDAPEPPPLPGDATVVTCIPNARTAGANGARNTGIAAAGSDLVAFCDDDDEWLPGKIRQQVELLSTTGTSVVCSGVLVSYRGRIRARRAPPAATFADLIRHRIPELHSSNLVVRRDAFAEIGLFDEELLQSQEYDWLLRAARLSPILSVPEPLVRIAWGDHSLFAESWNAKLDAIDRLLKKHPEIGADDRARARMLARRAFVLASKGERRSAWRDLRGAWTANRRERWLLPAAAVCSGIVGGSRVRRLLHAIGRGI